MNDYINLIKVPKSTVENFDDSGISEFKDENVALSANVAMFANVPQNLLKIDKKVLNHQRIYVEKHLLQVSCFL